MNFKQEKITLQEWKNMEIPIAESEKNILSMLMAGYSDRNFKQNTNLSFFALTKLERKDEIEMHVYKEFFEPDLLRIFEATPFAAAAFATTPLKLPSKGKKPSKRVAKAKGALNQGKNYTKKVKKCT